MEAYAGQVRNFLVSFPEAVHLYATLGSRVVGVQSFIRHARHLELTEGGFFSAEKTYHAYENIMVASVRYARQHGFERVSYGYEPGRPILRELDFEVQPGETVALVGPTGAGKSTIAALVLRLYDPWDGRVLVDGLDLRGVKLASLRGRIGFLPQEPFLLPLSVARNIAYGRPAARREEIIAAAVAAHADEFIRALPAGYDRRFTEDRFGLFVACEPDQADEVRDLLAASQPEEVRVVE